MRAPDLIKECSEMWVGCYLEQLHCFYLNFCIVSLAYCLKAAQTQLKPALEPGTPWTVKNTIVAKRWCCYQRRMTLWPLILSLFFLSHAVHQTSSIFSAYSGGKQNTRRFQLTHSHCVWGARRIHKLCSPCSTVKYFWDAIWQISAAHLLMNDLPVGNWLPAWRLISLWGGGFLNWRTLCLRDGMKTNGRSHIAGNGASQTSFCPRWSAIMSITIGQFIWAALLQTINVLGQHICFLLLEKSWRSAVSPDSFPLQWVQFQSFAV